jgi:hypothetical protein
MKKHEIGKLCCKIISIYTFICAIASVEGALLSLVSLQTISKMEIGAIAGVAIFFPTLLLICLSACFWLYADNIAQRLLPEKEDSEHVPSVISSNFESLKNIAFVIAGILILNTAFSSSLINQISSIIAQPGHYTIQLRTNLIAAGIRIVIGIWLILGTRQLGRISTRLSNTADNNNG